MRSYHAVLEVAGRYQTAVSALSRIYVRASGGQLIPISRFTTLERKQSAIAINHQGQFLSVTISFNLPPGVSLSQAVDAIRSSMREIGKPDAIQVSFQGTARDFKPRSRPRRCSSRPLYSQSMSC